MEKLILNKNRGWRGLAEAHLIDEANNTMRKMVFSFSQDVWNDMLNGLFIMQTKDQYIIIRFETYDTRLPKPTQQRSVLLKDVVLPVESIHTVSKHNLIISASSLENTAIRHFKMNRNNYTQSDWNCIGIRVTPMI